MTFVILGVVVVVGAVIALLKLKKKKELSDYTPASQHDKEMVTIKRNHDVELGNNKEILLSENTPLQMNNGNHVEEMKIVNENEESFNEEKQVAKEEIKYIDEQEEVSNKNV